MRFTERSHAADTIKMKQAMWQDLFIPFSRDLDGNRALYAAASAGGPWLAVL